MSNHFTLSSSAFKEEAAIPADYTCDGGNENPALSWQNPPAGTQSFALICDDPDAPREKPFVHWVIYNIPKHMASLPSGISTTEKLEVGSSLVLQGVNDAQRTGYYGPCPPSGTHRYFFNLYALDQMLDLAPAATVDQLRAAMQEHIIGTATLMGRYQRTKGS